MESTCRGFYNTPPSGYTRTLLHPLRVSEQQESGSKKFCRFRSDVQSESLKLEPRRRRRTPFYLDFRDRHVDSQRDERQHQDDVGKGVVWNTQNHHEGQETARKRSRETCRLTQQPAADGLQHRQDREEVQRRVDAPEAVRLPQAARDLLDQQRAQQHHHHQAEGVVDQHDCVAVKETQTAVTPDRGAWKRRWGLHSQRVHGLLRAVQRVHVVWAGVVQHGVPVRQHLDPTGPDAQKSQRLREQQSDQGGDAALQRRRHVLQQSTGTARACTHTHISVRQNPQRPAPRLKGKAPERVWTSSSRSIARWRTSAEPAAAWPWSPGTASRRARGIRRSARTPSPDWPVPLEDRPAHRKTLSGGPACSRTPAWKRSGGLTPHSPSTDPFTRSRPQYRPGHREVTETSGTNTDCWLLQKNIWTLFKSAKHTGNTSSFSSRGKSPL